jgi:threonine dehydratase
MRIQFDDTPSAANGTGAAALAAIIQERRQMSGKRIAAVLSGGNVDRDPCREVLGGPSCASSSVLP